MQEGSHEDLSLTQTVPKTQYDDLLKKYEALLQKERSGDLTEATGGAKTINTLDVETVGLAEELKKTLIPSQQPLNEVLNNDIPKVEYEALKADAVAAIDTVVNSNRVDVPYLGEDQMGKEMSKLEKVRSLFKEKKYPETLPLLRELEHSPSPQIQVRAKSLMGDLFYFQGEYDLAMQGHQDVVKNYGFSSYVIHSLERLVECAQKLQLSDQGKMYSQMLGAFNSGR